MNDIQNKQDLTPKKMSINEKIDVVVNMFVEGIDYNQLPGVKKKSLGIPGADKFVFMFELYARFTKDTQVLESFKDYKGVIIFKCELVDKSGRVWGEGRGAGQLGQGKNCETINSTVKMAEIRAKRDAVLNTFPIRDRFTQDIDDDFVPTKKTIKIKDNEVQTL